MSPTIDARTFDPALRQHALAVAQWLFDQTRADLSDGSTLENVEFDTECKRRGPHGSGCQIVYVTVRRRSDGRVVVGFPALIGTERMAQIIQVHNLAYSR